ncbi:MAG TPA: hypothetical protein GX507_11210 [Clostridia bacterium]|nr:hypothetical protein [Clostridia bacterium]
MVKVFGADESGSVGPLVILLLPALVFVISLVVDVGLLFVCKNLGATAVDIAALAAAQEIDLDRLAVGERYIKPQEAETTARTWIGDNLTTLVRLAGCSFPGDVAVSVVVYNATRDAPLTHEPFKRHEMRSHISSNRASQPKGGVDSGGVDSDHAGGAEKGRLLKDPTVCVTMSLPIRNGLLLGRLIPAEITAHADASVMEKPH